MKYLFILLLLFITSSEILSQALMGTALIKGSVTLQIEETQESYCQGVLSEKSETKETYSSQLTGNVFMDKNEINFVRMCNKRGGIPGGITGTKVTMDTIRKPFQKG